MQQTAWSQLWPFTCLDTEIKSQAEKGIEFRNSLVVPEVDADTQEKLHQREDHNHLLKRIVGCLREGLIPGLQVKFLRDALHDPGLNPKVTWL